MSSLTSFLPQCRPDLGEANARAAEIGTKLEERCIAVA